jgi:hypothetical protein
MPKIRVILWTASYARVSYQGGPSRFRLWNRVVERQC